MLPYQAVDLAAHGLTVPEVRREAWWIGADGTRGAGHRAIARALRACPWYWAWLGALLLLPPVSWIAALGYRLVARYRRRLPGSRPACGRGWDLERGAPLPEGDPPPCRPRRSAPKDATESPSPVQPT